MPRGSSFILDVNNFKESELVSILTDKRIKIKNTVLQLEDNFNVEEAFGNIRSIFFHAGCLAYAEGKGIVKQLEYDFQYYERKFRSFFG